MRIRVLSYNIHKGFKLGNRAYVLDAMREAIRAVNADLVFLQEVHGHTWDEEDELHPGKTQFEYLADQVWPHFAYGKNAAYTDGHHGNVILSRFPISHWENVDLSTNEFEKRGLLYARIDPQTLPDSSLSVPLHLLCTHLNLLGPSREIQMKSILQFIAKRVPASDPIIFAGDLNDWRGHLAEVLETDQLKEVFQHTIGEHARTFPSFFPTLRLDRVHVRNLKIIGAAVNQSKEWRKLSDHLGISAELESI